jgi:hypothetical protein
VLTRLVDQILDGTPHKAVALDDPKVDGLRGWHRGLAALAADGVALDLAALFEAYEIPDKHNPPPAHAVRVGGANLGKPYPPADGAVVITPKRDVVKARSAPAAAAVVPSPEVQPMTAAPLTHTPVSQPPVPKPVDPAAVTVPTAAPAPLSQDAWSVIDRLQRETADQHQRYLDAVAESHQAFLGMATQMMAQIVGNGGSGRYCRAGARARHRTGGRRCGRPALFRGAFGAAARAAGEHTPHAATRDRGPGAGGG